MYQAAAGWETLAIFAGDPGGGTGGQPGGADGVVAGLGERAGGYVDHADGDLVAHHGAPGAEAGDAGDRAGELVHGGDGGHAAFARDRDEPRHARGARGHQLPRGQHHADRDERGRLLRPDVEPGGRGDGGLPGGDVLEHGVRAHPADEADRDPRGRRDARRRWRIGQNAAHGAAAQSLRETAFAHVGAQATVESAGLQTGRAVSSGNMAAERAEGAAQKAQNAAAGQAAGQAATGRAAGCADGHPDGVAGGLDGRPDSAAGRARW